jgi:hypothetical protein
VLSTVPGRSRDLLLSEALHMFMNPTGIFINPATCVSTIAGTL